MLSEHPRCLGGSSWENFMFNKAALQGRVENSFRKILLLTALLICLSVNASGAKTVAGAYGDFKIDSSGCAIMASSLSTLICRQSLFVPADVGKVIYVSGAAASETLATTISAYIG